MYELKLYFETQAEREEFEAFFGRFILEKRSKKYEGATMPLKKAASTKISESTAQAIKHLIASKPGVTARELSEELNLQDNSIYTALRDLITDGQLVKSNERPARFFLNKKSETTDTDKASLLSNFGKVTVQG